MGGRMPVTRALPYQWYDTPNIRLITLNDFRRFAREVGYRILKEIAIETQAANRQGNIIRVLPDFRATYGIFLIAS